MVRDEDIISVDTEEGYINIFAEPEIEDEKEND